jgi:pimeloyl-ACP methyl ester carboxylesterase
VADGGRTTTSDLEQGGVSQWHQPYRPCELRSAEKVGLAYSQVLPNMFDGFSVGRGIDDRVRGVTVAATKSEPCYPFRSARTRDRYLAFYDDRAARRWPAASEDRTVRTNQGETFVRVSGPADAPPLVLLPGVRTNSRGWSPMIAGLSRAYRTYAVDPIYDIGRSVSVRPIVSRDDVMAWLDRLLDALDLPSGVNLMGASLGSHVAAEYAMHAPERLSKVVWLSMAGVVSPPNMFVAAPILSMCVIPSKTTMAIPWRWMFPHAARSTGLARAMFDDSVEEMVLFLKCCRMTPPPSGLMRVLSDSELRGMEVPILYIAGADERICSTALAVERLAAVAPDIETSVVPDAAHDACWVQPDTINSRVMEFLAG